MESHTIKALEKQVDRLVGRVTALEWQIGELLDYLADPQRCKIADIDRFAIERLQNAQLQQMNGAMRGEVERGKMARELEREAAIDRLVQEQRRADEEASRN